MIELVRHPALRHNPGHAKAQFELGNLMLKLSRHALAVSQFEGVLRMQPDNAGAHYGMALALAKVGRATEAVSHFREALWLRPDWPQAKNDFA